MAEAVSVALARGPDILVRTAPPLSATSDGPLTEVAKPPASASNSPDDHAAGVPTEMSPEDQAAARSARVDPGPSQDAGKETVESAATEIDLESDQIQVDGKSVNLPPWMKREITKARNRQREAETTAKTAADELAAIRATVEEMKARIEPPAKVEPEVAADPRPTRDRFDDPDSYDEALTEWAEREGGRKVAAKVAQEREAAETAAKAAAAEAQRTAVDAEVARMSTAWNEKIAKATEKYPDYVEVAQSDDVKISMPMAHAIVELENGTDVAYYLGKNLEEAARIASLTNPVAQAVQITLLSARLATPATRTARARPLEPLASGNAASDTSEREASMEEVAARVNGRIAATRRPFLSTAPGMARH